MQFGFLNDTGKQNNLHMMWLKNKILYILYCKCFGARKRSKFMKIVRIWWILNNEV